tara:strand:- start:2227 stop:2490 length:264 start_codon:yes stop_codon:yes gene_type:complete
MTPHVPSPPPVAPVDGRAAVLLYKVAERQRFAVVRWAGAELLAVIVEGGGDLVGDSHGATSLKRVSVKVKRSDFMAGSYGEGKGKRG